MKSFYSESIMASYATFKELYNSQKYNSPYQILSEFIKYAIISNSLSSFTSTDIQGYLNNEFGFNPPIAVIRTALKSIPEVELNNKKYCVGKLQEDVSFYKIMKQAEEKSDLITSALINYAEEEGLTLPSDRSLSQALIAFVLDEEIESSCQRIIGRFIIENELNPIIASSISTIREGSILYSGLAFNFADTGSLSQPITLYLDTEILFDLVGLNGILYKALADDFYKLVAVANRQGRIISLRYFARVKDEIDSFFHWAENVKSGKSDINFNKALEEIVNGCGSISDISDKKVDFFRKLRYEYSVLEDEKNDYYTEADIPYNLEGLGLTDYPENEEANIEGYVFCSHINKLRKGFQTADYLSSKYLCVTDTRRVLEISKSIADYNNSKQGKKNCDYAVSLSFITNLLWYKLNRGFGSTDFPKNLDVVIKARTILSGYISQEISSTYQEIRNKVSSGELSREQAAARIIALKEKNTLPESLNSDNIDNSLNFTESFFSQFEETLAQNRRLLSERDIMINELSENISGLQEKLSKALAQNEDKQKQINLLVQKVEAIEKNKKEEARKKQKRKALARLIWSILWKVLTVVFVVLALFVVCKIFDKEFPVWLGILLSIVGLASYAVPIIKKDFKRYLDNAYKE